VVVREKLSVGYPRGYDEKLARRDILKIPQRLEAIFERAEAEGLATNVVADMMAEENIKKQKRL